MPNSNHFAELLLQWEEMRQQGKSVTAEQLCSKSPEDVAELQRRINIVLKMESMLGINTGSGANASIPLSWGGHTSAQAFQPCPQFPDHDILGVIGSGGMGIVYRAQHRTHHRVVAIKALHPPDATSRRLERFQSEIRAVAALNHPHIVQIYEVGQVGNVPYFSMEFVDGGNLADKISEGPWSAEDAAAFVERIANAIGVVHRTGYIHRDLKPANILLTVEGEPKVTDFGLAKELGSDIGLTGSRDVLGTMGYMAPEQLDPTLGSLGPAADIYALGMVLHELLTGKTMCRADALMTIRRVLGEEPQWTAILDRNVPRDLKAIFLKCLAKMPTDRYDSAESLAMDLRRFCEGRPVEARHQSIVSRIRSRFSRGRAWRQWGIVIAVVTSIWVISRVVGHYRELSRQRVNAVRVAPQAREILERNCYACHGRNPMESQKNLNVLNHADLIASERHLIVPGFPARSRLLQRIADGSMPPEEMERELPRLAEKEVTILYDWILGGAPSFAEAKSDSSIPPVIEISPQAAAAKELFQRRCYECHRYNVAKGGIKILHHRLLLHTRKVVIPYKAHESELFQLITSRDDTRVMPPPPHERLSPHEISVVQQWIEAGAPPFPNAEWITP